MMQKFKTFFLAAKTGTAKFLRAKGIYVVIMTLVACAGTAAALIFIPRGESEAPQPTDPGSEVNLSGDERLYVMKTPEFSPTPSPSPIPDFTQAPATAAPSAKPLWSPPVRGEIIWGYSVNELIYSRTLRQWMTHAGVDVASPKGTEVNAVFGGTVEAVYEDDLMGVTVEVTSGEWTAVYANLAAQPPVEEGVKIEAGDVVGLIGDTAVSECADKSHVHFGLSRGGESVDPTKYVRFIKE